MEGSRLSVELLAPSVADEDAVAASLAILVNRVYAVGEAGLWQEGRERILPDEMAGLVRGGEMAVARLQHRIVGCVRVSLEDGGRVGELGLLAADPAHRGVGVGRALVDFAEATNRSRGVELLQLQLLVPTVWEHPVKRFLQAWYARRGYVVVARRPFGDVYPEAAQHLATPCLLLTMQKRAEEPPPAGGGPTAGQARLRIVRDDDGPALLG